MSNWYVRRSRERFWAKGMEQDKINAYMTLYTALVTVAKAAAPMIPFMTEDIYQNLVKSIDASAPESIHLCDFPEVHENWIDPKMEEDMADLLEIVVMGRAARNTANIKNRQPIGTMYVKSEFQLSEFYKEIIEDELNVKEVVFKDDIADFISYSFKPQMRTVGPKYGKLLNKIKTTLSELDGNKAMAELKSTGELKLDIDGQEIVLLEEDLLIDMAQMEGYVSESDHTITVVLDTNLTPELIEEGFVRELVSKIQTMRKEAGFEVMDKIRVYAKDNDKIVSIMKNHGDEIKSEVLAEEIVELNESRKLLTMHAVEQAKEIAQQEEYVNDRVLVIFLPDCHESLAGIVAGRIREAYYRPTLVVTRSEHGAKGSGRSIESYSMYEELCKCEEYLTQFGGHPMAAGFLLKEADIDPSGGN